MDTFLTNKLPLVNKIKIILITICLPLFTLGQSNINSAGNLGNYEYYIEKLGNSQDLIFEQVLKKYDDHLLQNPGDVLIEIQKCKFIQFAQYDEYDDYNPNQEMFDSCKANLEAKSPNHPAVLLFISTCTWGEDLEKVFSRAKQSIRDYPEKWSDDELSEIYFSMASTHYYSDNYEDAHMEIKKAISHNPKYEEELLYPQILNQLNLDEQAISALVLGLDSTKDIWYLDRKASLLLELEQYNSALEIYNLITKMDTSYIDKGDLANVMDGIGEHEKAREYLIGDTIGQWNPEKARLNLFLHDLEYGKSDSAWATYNNYRDLGFKNDPIAYYRIKLFFTFPILPISFRDIVGILLFTLIVIVLILIPSIWILPVYTIGHKFRTISSELITGNSWGLKSFWWVSIAYVLANFLVMLMNPEQLHALINWDFYSNELTDKELGESALVFILVFGTCSLLTLKYMNFKFILFENWTLGKLLKSTLGLFVIFKIISVFYIRIGINIFDIDLSELLTIPVVLLSSKIEINALVVTYGNTLSILLVALMVPIYEEVIFRGVILESSKKYLSFNGANILQSFLFAFVHLDLFLFPIFFLFGMLTGNLQRKSGGLFPGIIFHVINNLLAMIYIILKP